MQYKLAVALLLSSVLMSGCATSGTALPGTANQPGPVRPDEALLQLCPNQLPKLEGLTGADALRAAGDAARQYFECADAHNSLVEFERKRLGD